MTRALVIGGTAFIGRNLVEQLLERGDEVVIMHRGRGHPYGDRVREIRCDRNDLSAVHAALDGQRFDLVFDNVYDFQRGTSAEQVMAAATALAPGVRRYVFTSSVAVYPMGGPTSEDATLVSSDDPNVYAAQKASTERALFALNAQGKLPVTTLRPAFIFGPHNPFEREAFFWDRIVAGRPVIIPEEGSATMQWVHVRDVARAAVLATERDVAAGRAYNVALEPVTQVEFVRLLAKVAGRGVTLMHVPRAKLLEAGGGLFAPPYYFGTYLDLPPMTVPAERARRELGLELTPFEEGLRETFAWYRQQERPGPDFSWEDQFV
jgi:2'-hydroxyisoflavone reductase